MTLSNCIIEISSFDIIIKVKINHLYMPSSKSFVAGKLLICETFPPEFLKTYSSRLLFDQILRQIIWNGFL